jgi:hypothetical protein
MMLLDLEVEGADVETVRAEVERWAQVARHASLGTVATGEARGVLIRASAEATARALATAVCGG